MSKKLIKKLFFGLSLLLPVVILTLVAMIIAYGELSHTGGLVEYGFFESFGLALLLYIPILLALDAVLNLVKEIILCVKFNTKRRKLIIISISSALFVVAFGLFFIASGASNSAINTILLSVAYLSFASALVLFVVYIFLKGD